MGLKVKHVVDCVHRSDAPHFQSPERQSQKEENPIVGFQRGDLKLALLP